jgi:hypothetical protein
VPVYDIYNPTRTMRIFHDGVVGSQKAIRVGPGQTIRGVALGETTVKMIQTRAGHVKLALVSEGGFQEAVSEPPRRAPQPRTVPSRRVAVAGPTPNVPIRHAAPDEVAVIIGGAETIWSEWAKAREMCGDVGARPVTFVVNDSIPLFQDRIDHAVTLHPDKYEREWQDARAARGLPPCGVVWANRRHKVINKDTPDWGGSSGLFAIKIARELGYDKIVLCGVPMTLDGGHVIRKAPWRAADQFWRAWERHKRELAAYVRSFSGRTAQMFGSPTASFLANGLPPRIGPELPAGRVAELIN